MGNAQSIGPRGHDLAVVLQDPERSLSDLGIPIPVGGYRSTPELRNELHDKIFSTDSVREIGSSETLGGDALPDGAEAQEALLYPAAVAQLLRAKDGQRVDISALAAILHELKKTVSVEELVMLRQALLPGMDSEISLSGQHSRKVQPTRDVRGFAERQKSINGPSPGTATRSKVSRLRKQPTKNRTRSPEGTRPKTWAVEDFRASPLSHLAGLSSPKPMLRSSMPPQRPITPLDLECVSLGNLRAGTLRVTNGAVTPEPSIRSGTGHHLTTNFSPHAQDDYFTCSEGTDEEIGCSPDQVLTDDSKSTVSVEGSPTTPKFIPRLHSFDMSRKPEQKIASSPIGSRKAVQRFVFDDGLSETVDVVDDSDQPPAFTVYRKEALANPFVVEEQEKSSIENSILNSSPIDTPKKPTTPAPPAPKPNAAPFPDISSSDQEHADFCRETAYLVAGQRQSNLTRDVFEPQSEGGTMPSQSEYLVPRYDPQASSGRQSPPREEPSSELQSRATRKTAPMLSLHTSGIQTPYAERNPASSQGRLSASPHVTQQQSIYDATGITSSVEWKDNEPPLHSSPNAIYSDRGSRSAADILNDLESPVIPLEGTTSLPTSAEKAKKRNKLQKKRFSKQDVRDTIAVESSIQSPVQNVPCVPVHLAANLEQRMKGFQPLEHTFDSVSTVEVRSIASGQVPKAPEIRFPSPLNEAEASPLSNRGRQSRRSSIGPGTSPSRLFRGLSRRASKERKVSDPHEVIDGEIMGVRDFGALPDLVGASPYDAISKATKRPQSEDLSTIQPRLTAKPTKARPVRGMDDKTASEFAKARSRDLLVNAEDRAGTMPSSATHSPQKRGHVERSLIQSRDPASEVPPLPKGHRNGARPQTYGGASIWDWSNNRNSPRNDVFDGPRLLWNSKGQHEPEANGASDPRRDPESATPAPLSGEVLGAWEAQAAFWRRRREQDYQAQYSAKPKRTSNYDYDEEATSKQDPTEHAHPTGPSSATEAPSPADTFPKRHIGAPLQRLASTLHASPRLEPPRTGARSPSPSIKERAAFFERAEAEAVAGARGRTPSPARVPAGAQTAAALLSSYAASGHERSAQASAGAGVGGGAGAVGFNGMRAALRDLR